MNVTLKVHVAPAATVAPQGVAPDGAAAKSPLATRLEIVSVPPELLVNVTDWGALVPPTASFPNARLAGDTATGNSPVPDTATTCGLPAPELAMVTAPLIAPVFDGANATEKVHFAEGARVPPQGDAPLPAAEKSALPARLLMVTELALLLVTVTVLAALVAPIPVAVKVNDVGLKLKATAGPPVAAPVSATTNGLNAPLVVTASAPLIVPLYCGANVTAIVQLAAAASDAPQVPPVTE